MHSSRVKSLSLSLGHIENTTWKLVKLTDLKAEFQNIKYADMRMALKSRTMPDHKPGAQVTNEF